MIAFTGRCKEYKLAQFRVQMESNAVIQGFGCANKLELKAAKDPKNQLGA